MACATLTVSFGFRISSSLCPLPSARASQGLSVHLAPFNKLSTLRLGSSHSVSVFGSVLPQKLCTISPFPHRLRSLTIVSAKGYKRKTHKASAKRFRVTGRGKIVRRRAGKQHLLYKKNNKRKLRLSKMVRFFPTLSLDL
ncbi:50S ribosomal protein L35, chloroplastic [Morella rubra]|uniref:50S ribosomal protein L35 n=1 Tax=Morella rubra TaxID=262757 RepID=A0A6A1VH58_9ROSI|nr:50S ribosomal protein L35, chloroplastic [Morella rubra]